MKDWRAYTVVVVASGPSLSDEQVALVKRARQMDLVRVIVTNNTIWRLAWADVAFFGDYLAVEHYRPRMDYAGEEWWTSSRPASQRFQGMRYVEAEVGDGLGERVLRMNGNTGAMAINLATLWRARRIVLIGFDMKLAADGRPHWFGNHPEGLIQTQRFADWIASMKVIGRDAGERGIEILNCTTDSALECFERADLEGALWPTT